VRSRLGRAAAVPAGAAAAPGDDAMRARLERELAEMDRDG
jgi:hypothetical protein